jgi:ribonuclease Z
MPPGGPGKPGKMGHSTVKQAASYAQSLDVKTLILIHGSDDDLPHRKAAYTQEARQSFSGTIYAPDDLDVIELT